MVNLQRASAGSGKTYALARAYIKMLISESDASGRCRLRPDGALPEAVRRILAITFTNKATAEMKSRIVTRLAELAAAGRRLDRALPGERENVIKSVTYLRELSEATGASPEEISHSCDKALRAVLDDYSGFQVSTIDSFFQTVLRTFAYEVDINDSFELELDSAMLAETGIDLTMESLSEGVADESTEVWLRKLSSNAVDKGRRWNPATPASGKDSIRAAIFQIVKQMQSEDFKRKRHSFDQWFAHNPDYAAVVDQYRQECEKEAREALAEAKKNAAAARQAFADSGLSVDSDSAAYLSAHIRAVEASADPLKFIKNNYSGLRDKIASDPTKALSSKISSKAAYRGAATSIASAVSRMYEALDTWKEALTSEKVRLWSIYEPTIGFPALMHNVRAKVQEFLNENNIVELSDTNTLLSRIIGDDDAPFIYERLGSRLEHFLIDEFQDTSAMQWDNLRPLVSESVAGGFDNLIIGDAKQSIYRFRNADPSLITTRVPAHFPGQCRQRGDARQDNSNHRSLERIVRFNNLFFARAATALDSVNARSGIDTEQNSLTRLYGNVVQYPARMTDGYAAGKGYVELNFTLRETPKGADTGTAAAMDYAYIGPLIDSLLDRGYRQADIGILVERNDQATAVIEHLLQYTRRAGRPREISFVSDESLRLSLARSVRVIVSTLELMSSSAIKTDRYGKDHITGSAAYSTITRMAAVSQHLDFSEAYRQYMEGDEGQQSVAEVLGKMYSMTLPALVEVIVNQYVPEALQQSEAPFIAAFQDAVLDYCKVYPTDIASFLDWWRTKGSRLTLTTPRGTDAVNIMTIHKSKGLEFKCVILPQFSPTLGKESPDNAYLWMEPALRIEGTPLPPLLPVKIDRRMAECAPARQAYLNYLYSDTMDRLNSVYVAFTRACDELYVYCPLSKTQFGIIEDITGSQQDEDADECSAPEAGKKAEAKESAKEKLCNNLRNTALLSLYLFLPECEAPEPVEAHHGAPFGEQHDWLAAESDICVSDITNGHLRITYGSPVDNPAMLRLHESSPSADTPQLRKVDSYSPGQLSDILRFKRAPVAFDESDLIDEEVTNPRRRGNVLHAILADVKNAADLDKAVRRHVISGELTPVGGARARRQLSEALSRPEIKPWFDGSMRVLNERHLLWRGCETRPDRVLVSHDGSRAIVIDYKFGSLTQSNYDKKKKEYADQVRGYMRRIGHALRIRDVEGWLWYVARDEIVRVE